MPTHDNLSPNASSDHSVGEPEQKSLSNDQRRTMLFVGGALACLLITGLIAWSRRPAPIEEYGKVGQQFYPDFVDPTLATSLQVYAFDTEKVKPLDFQVTRLDNGRWVIPSHHNYPTDAEDQLAKTAASVIGIERGAMITRWETDHALYGVVDPRQDTLSVGDVEGIGKRIILEGEDKAVLADYIIGKKLEGEENEYYVRHPEEDEVYITKLDINLSTKFADWIDTDLLRTDSFDITEVTVNDYSFDEVQGQITKRDINTLSRKTSSDPWAMDGLNEETEQVNEDAMSETINTIADLKILGVREKLAGLTPDLQLDRSALKAQQDLNRLQVDLMERGFVLQPGEGGDQQNLQLIAREGELFAATNKGLIYRLYFGRAFTGSQEELEIGLGAGDDASGLPAENDGESKAGDAKTDADDSSSSADTASADTASEDTASEDTAAANENAKPGRYVFVRVGFDDRLLGDKLVEPTEPQKPAELVADEKEEKSDADASSELDAIEGDDTSDATSQDESNKEGEEDPLDEIRRQYDEAKSQYQSDLAEYQREKADFDKEVEEGEKTAEELNRRFADWYYVIPGESFDKLRLTRADLVKPKEEEEATEDSTGDDTSDLGPTQPNNAAIEGPLPGTSVSGDENAAGSEPAVDETPMTDPPSGAEPASEEPVTEQGTTDAPSGEEPASADTPKPPPASEAPQEEPVPGEPQPEGTVPQ